MSLAVALWIDDADYIDDRSEEALEYFLSMLDRLGIRATFKIVGEKARTLHRHGRDDIIRALCRHDLCYHSDLHSYHPTVTEYTEPLTFHDGAAEFEKREIGGLHDLREIFGREIVGYGQPGESFTPDAFPVLRKYGADVNLDDHFILDVDGMAFSYCGVLNFNHVRRILRYDYRDPNGMEIAKQTFDALAAEEGGRDYPENVRLFSVFYHPSEFFSSEYLGDYYNFRGGKNHAYDGDGKFLGYTLPPSWDREIEHRNMENVGAFLKYMQEQGASFVTATDLRTMQIRRNRFITKQDIEALATSYAGGNITFFDIGGEYVSASEGFLLLSQYLSGKQPHPYLIYGPEMRAASVIPDAAVVTREQVTSAMAEQDSIMGYPQLKSLYRVGDCSLTPLDLCATAAYLIANQLDVCHPISGNPLFERHVYHHSNWSNRWLFGDDFYVPNTYEKTRLQCWTLKPIRY